MGTYQHDYAAFGRLVLQAPWMAGLMLERAERGKAVGEAVSPVYEEGPHPGRYKAAWSASVEIGISADGTRRAIGTVRNDAPEARFVEWGTKNNPAHHCMLTAMGAMG
jgi:hypothetical protein